MAKAGAGITEEGRLVLRQNMIAMLEKRLEGHYPVAPLRDAYLQKRKEYGLTLNEVALRMNWIVKSGGKKGQPEGGRVSRSLGMRPEMGRSGRYHCVRERINPELGLKLAEAIGVAWWEVWPDA